MMDLPLLSACFVAFALTLYVMLDAASQWFLLMGATLVTPVIPAYSAFAYWVFRGRAPEKGWQQ